MRTLAVIFLLLPFVVKSQKKQDTLHWSFQRALNWNDYKGYPDSASSNGAMSYTGLYYTPYYDSSGNLKVNVYSVFDRNQSWVKAPSRNKYALKHEQGHFNLTEVFARKLRYLFAQYRPVNQAKINSDLYNIYASVELELEQMQKEYDNETTKPIHPGIQNEWNKKIKRWLSKNWADKSQRN